MDVYSLINSKAISDYCRKIQYKFNTEEIAVLIHRNKTFSIEKKIKAYQELMQEYPDMEIMEKINCKHYDSVRDMIKEEITRLNTLVEKMKQDEPDVIYAYDPYYKSICEYGYNSKLDNVYRTFEETLESVTDEIKEDDDIPMFKLYKKSLVNTFPNIIAEYIVREDNQVAMTNIYDITHQDIDNIFLNIPTPFKSGDILVNYCNLPFIEGVLPNRKDIFVLDWLITWREDLTEKLSKGYLDSGDMYGGGYSLFEDSDIASTLVLDEKYGYDSFEYYENELEGNYRILKGISNLLKDEITIMNFLDVYNQIRMEGMHRNLQIYTNEGLELAGLNKDDIKRLRGGRK